MADPQIQDLMIKSGFEPVLDSGPEAGTAGGRKRVRPLDADHQEARIQSAMTGEFPMNRRDALKLGLAASATRARRAARVRARRIPEPADQARGAVLGRRRERHRRPAMGRTGEAAARFGVSSKISAAPAARSASWRCSAPSRTATAILLGSTSTMVLNTMNANKVSYDPVKDFVPIAIFCVSSTSIAVHSSVPAKNVQELIAYVKANTGKLSPTARPAPAR